MTYDSEGEEILLFGGRNGDDLLNDLWNWDGREWTPVSEEGPVLRGVYASAFDRRRGQLVIHGGGDLQDGDWHLDARTWTWAVGPGWRVAADGVH